MCLCNPNVKTPWCLKCMPLDLGGDSFHLSYDRSETHEAKMEESYHKVKEIIMIMNGMSEEGFTNKYMNDPHFNKGMNLLVELIYQGKPR